MFKKRRQKIDTTTNFPSGTVVKSEGGIFLVKGSVLLRIPTKSILDSWNYPRIVEVDHKAIGHFPVAGRIGYRDGTALKGFGTRKIYLVSGQKIRHVTDPQTLRKLNISLEDVLVVSDEEISIQKEGEPLGSI